MRIFFDTEFIDDGKTIDLISIGLVREDGEELYMESSEVDLSRGSEWVQKNVVAHLTGERFTRDEMRKQIREFVGSRPEFWAYFSAYDWVCLCQLFGRMLDLPPDWPMWCRDLVYLWHQVARPRINIEHSQGKHHNALADAHWNREVFWFLVKKGGLVYK